MADGTHEKIEIPATFRYSAFYDLLSDAAFQHRQAKSQNDSYQMNRYARASVLAASLSIECAANCLISSLDLSKSLHSEVDRLASIAKIEIYMKLREVDGFDRGCSAVQRAADLLNVRNHHVHPKATKIPASVSNPQDGGENMIFPMNIESEGWKHLKIPKHSMFWSSNSSFAALSTVRAFYKYIFCDLLNATTNDLDIMLQSRLEIGNTSVHAIFDEMTTELQIAGEYGIDFKFLLQTDV